MLSGLLYCAQCGGRMGGHTTHGIPYYRCPEGEVDLIAKHKDYLVFIEVRTKKSTGFGSPEESITSAKKERLRAIAAHYRQTHNNLPPLWRIDVVAVELDRRGKPSRIELIENAVGEA